MPLLAWLIRLLILAVVLAFAAVFVAILAAVGVALMLTAFVLHQFGWDRRLMAYLAKRHGVRVHVVRPGKFPSDEWDEPIDTHGTLIDVEPRRPA